VGAMNEKYFPSSRSKILKNPSANKLKAYDSTYAPVDCDFTDELELSVIRKWKVQVKFLKAEGAEATIVGHLVDIYTSNKEEFLKISEGTTIRLDRVVQIEVMDDIKSAIHTLQTERETSCEADGSCKIAK